MKRLLEPAPARRDRARLRTAFTPDDLPEDINELAAAADGEIDEEPARRTLAQFAVTAVICAVVLILLVAFSSQWVRSAAIDFAGRTPCTGSDCVQLSLSDLERNSRVVFPNGTTVEWSSRSKNFLNDEFVNFEVRIPAGLPVPDAPQPWQSQPDPETGTPTYVKILKEQGLKDVRWTDGGWITGVETNGDTIVQGSYSSGYG
jgi:hypothetical protein